MYSETCELFLKCKDCKVLDIFSTETTLILYMENVWNKGNPKTMQNREDINENDKKDHTQNDKPPHYTKERASK